jgi:hypothetical protein
MTGSIEDGGENAVFNDLVDRFVLPSVRSDGPLRPDPAAQSKLETVLAEVRTGPSRVAAGSEDRMIPSIARKDRRVPFRPR